MTDRLDQFQRAISGDRRALARLISLIEDRPDESHGLLADIFSETGQAFTIGITGAPGAGKSTLTDQLLMHMRADGHEVAVLAVDPSSPFTGGAILGDRIRMQGHASDAGVYVRSMGSRGHLGGVSGATSRTIVLLDAVGFPYVLVETVGVGQAEVEIVESADTTVVVVNPGWGDSIQANKAGLLEIGDVFVVNKADRVGTDETIKDLKQMLMMGPQGPWVPPIVSTIASRGEGVHELWQTILNHRRHLIDSGALVTRRRRRCEAEVRRALAEEVARRTDHAATEGGFAALIDEVVERRTDPWTAARSLLD